MIANDFKLSTNLTFDTVVADETRLRKYVQSSKLKDVCMDLSHIKQCDSAGLALLIEAKRLCQYYNKILTLECMPKSIHDLAKFCGVDVILGCEHI